MVKPKISIIIPVWNTAKFLPRCIDSILNQTLKDIEIIAVNDGSTDDSLSILKEYAKKDSRIKVINKPNKGVATTRNTGLKAANAPYIMWCDSDDAYMPTMCQEMLDSMTKQKVDIVACGMKVVNDDIDKKLTKDIEEYVRLKFSGKQNIDMNLIVHTDVSLPSKIFKKSIIDKHKIHFPDGLHFEDAFFMDEYMTVAKNIFFLEKKLYIYYRHNNSIMSRSFKQESIALDYLQIIPKTYSYLKQNQLFDSYKDLFWHRFMQYYSFAYDNAPRGKKSVVRNFGKDFLNKHSSELAGTKPYIARGIRLRLSRGHNIKIKLAKIAKRILPLSAYRSLKKISQKIIG